MESNIQYGSYSFIWFYTFHSEYYKWTYVFGNAVDCGSSLINLLDLIFSWGQEVKGKWNHWFNNSISEKLKCMWQWRSRMYVSPDCLGYRNEYIVPSLYSCKMLRAAEFECGLIVSSTFSKRYWYSIVSGWQKTKNFVAARNFNAKFRAGISNKVAARV